MESVSQAQGWHCSFWFILEPKMFSFVKCLRISLAQANESRDEVGKQHLDGSKCMDILYSQYCSQYVWKRSPFNIRLGSCVYLGPTWSKFCPVSGLPSLVQNELAIGPDLTMASLQQVRTVAGKLFSYLAHLSPNHRVSYGQSIDCLAESVFFPRIAVYCRVCSYQQFCWPTFCNHDSGLLQSQNRTSQLCLSATRCACGQVDWQHVLDEHHVK